MSAPASKPRPVVRLLDRRTPPHILTLVAMAGLSALTMNVFLPSLPGMAVFFGVPYAQMQLAVTLYLGLSAALQIILGPLSDRYGRRPVLLASGAIFLVASLGTILAPTVEVFLVCRMAQAVIASGLVLSRAIVRDMVPDAEAASMIGYVTMGMSIVPMIGPVLGGILDEAFGWQANFSLLLVLGVAVVTLVYFDLGETATRRQASFAAQVRLYPILFTSRRFWGYAVAAMGASGAFFSYLGGAPFVGGVVFGLSPAEVGIYFAIPAAGYGLGNFLSGRFSARVGMDRMVLAGSCVLGAGMATSLGLSLAGLSNATVFFALVSTVGIGNGMTLPNATAGMMSVRPDLAGTASGLGGVLTIGGGAAMSAVAGLLLVPGSSEVALLALMFASAVVSVVATVAVIFRDRRRAG